MECQAARSDDRTTGPAGLKRVRPYGADAAPLMTPIRGVGLHIEEDEMNISRNKIRGFAQAARDEGKVVTFSIYALDFHLSSTDSAGRKKGTYELTSIDGGSFKTGSIGKLVEYIQALTGVANAEGPTTPPTNPDVTFERVLPDEQQDDDIADLEATVDSLTRDFITNVNDSVTNHAPFDSALSFKKSERRIRSHRRKLRRSGIAKGLSVLG